jgi:FkbH-like protein
MTNSVGVCSNVDLRTLELCVGGTKLSFMENSVARTSIAAEPEFWDGPSEFLVFLDPSRVLPGGRFLSADDHAISQWFASRLAELSGLAARYTDRIIVVANVATTNDTFDADAILHAGTDGKLAGQLNGMIHSAIQDHPNVVVLDWSRIVATYGSSTLYDDKYWYLARLPLSGAGARLLWEEFRSTVMMMRGVPKKVLCLDLDNTLWRGICGETGARGVGLSEEGIDKAYRDFQRYIKGIKNLGVLLAINSKNNTDDALAVFRDNPMMILQESDFAAMRINWSDKVANMCSMAEELSLGLDAFVFIDDSHAEREFVRSALPDVAVPDFPAEPFELPAWFRNKVARNYFRRRAYTREDQGKTEQYARQRERRAASAAVSPEESIARLQIELTVESDNPANLARLHQMSQKTNQFNLTTIRYTEAELQQRIHSADYTVWNAWYVDRFGDEGIVAMAVVSHELHKLESFVMSCRVIGRGVEFALLRAVCEDLSGRGWRSLAAEYIATARNGPCKDLLVAAAFSGAGPDFAGDLPVVLERLKSLGTGIRINSTPRSGRDRPRLDESEGASVPDVK